MELRFQSLPPEDQKMLRRVRRGREPRRGTRKRGGGSWSGVRSFFFFFTVQSLSKVHWIVCLHIEGRGGGGSEDLRKEEERSSAIAEFNSMKRKSDSETPTLCEYTLHRLNIISIPHSHQTKMMNRPRLLTDNFQPPLARSLGQIPH